METLDIIFDFSFSCLYLGELPEGLSKGDTYLMKIFMVASKKAITKCWLQKNPPTMRLLTNIINSIQAMENLTFVLRLQKDKGEEYWKKWDRYKHKDS
mgnify:CR=1 FL=1